jgi:hypothetical protein
MDFEKLFEMGMDRKLPKLLTPPENTLSIGLGESGSKKHGHISLGLPDWEWPKNKIPAEDDSVGIIHCYHFMEHLTGEDAINLLNEVQRVLCVGGIFQFCIPYYNASMASQGLTHKSFWTEETFRVLMDNKYYDPSFGRYEWKLKQHYLVIAAIVERNTCIIGQLVKVD